MSNFDQILNYISFAIGIISLVATYLVYRKTLGNIKVKSISVGMIGHGSIREKSFSTEILSLEVLVHNTGLQAANNCSALIIFPKKSPLPFHPQVHGRLHPKETTFAVEPNCNACITAAWSVDIENGTLMGAGMTYQEFIDTCLPATIEISFSGKVIRRELTHSMVKRQYEDFQSQLYKAGQ